MRPREASPWSSWQAPFRATAPDRAHGLKHSRPQAPRTAARAGGFEVKAASSWRREHSAVLRALVAEKKLRAGYGIYTGDAVLADGGIAVLPVRVFAERLRSGKIFR